MNGLINKGESVSVYKRINELGDTVAGLQELIVYGIKGLASYADHAQILGRQDDAVYGFIHKTLARLVEKPSDIDELLSLALATGETNLKAMELLDAANTGTYGHPEPTKVRVTPIRGKCIVVSGHDLKDLEELLKQTEGRGINVYTHGEMLPCNAGLDAARAGKVCCCDCSLCHFAAGHAKVVTDNCGSYNHSSGGNIDFYTL